jgi:hypothetical protein
MPILDWINFGKVSAERDDELAQYFFDNGVLKTVIKSPTSFLVLGRKGAGKTAVFKYLQETKAQFIGANDILVPLSFEDYNWNIHALLTNDAKAESMLYKQSWRFVILVEAIKAYREWFHHKGKQVPTRLLAATKVLEKLFDSPLPTIYQIVGRKLLTLSGMKLPKAGIDLEEGDLESLKAEGGEITFDKVQASKDLQQSLSENIENLISYLDLALSTADGTWPTVFICFDKVDEAWDEVSFESSRKVISGLVTACDALNTQYKGRIRPVVFLREDIFDVLSINDANKLREDCGALLHWNRDSLVNLILKRINYFGSRNGQSTVTDLDALFDKQEMRQGTRPSGYLLRRTMMRPRDLISLLNRTVDTMKEKVNDPFAKEKVAFDKLECESIYEAEPGYSDWLRKELIDEWAVQMPIIKDLLNAIQNNGSTNFDQETLKRELEKLGGAVSNAQLLGYLRFLFDNSIIGFKLGNSTEWRYQCFYPSQGFVESEEYRVHYGLVRALNLKEPRG